MPFECDEALERIPRPLAGSERLRLPTDPASMVVRLGRSHPPGRGDADVGAKGRPFVDRSL